MAGLAAWEVRERALRLRERLQQREEVGPGMRRQPCPYLRGEHQLPAFVVANEQRLEAARNRLISADHELLPPVELYLDPRAAPLARFVAGVPAFATTPSR